MKGRINYDDDDDDNDWRFSRNFFSNSFCPYFRSNVIGFTWTLRWLSPLCGKSLDRVLNWRILKLIRQPTFAFISAEVLQPNFGPEVRDANWGENILKIFLAKKMLKNLVVGWRENFEKLLLKIERKILNEFLINFERVRRNL